MAETIRDESKQREYELVKGEYQFHLMQTDRLNSKVNLLLILQSVLLPYVLTRKPAPSTPLYLLLLFAFSLFFFLACIGVTLRLLLFQKKVKHIDVSRLNFDNLPDRGTIELMKRSVSSNKELEESRCNWFNYSVFLFALFLCFFVLYCILSS